MTNRDFHVEKASIDDARDDEGKDGGSAEKAAASNVPANDI